MKEKIRNFRDLDVWKKGIEIVKDVYKITEGFPRQELYGLVSQMQRSAVSIPSNIAEGFNRFHNKEYKQFLYVALGSCAELETQIEISIELRYLDSKTGEILLEKINHESRMLTNLIKKLGVVNRESYLVNRDEILDTRYEILDTRYEGGGDGKEDINRR